MIVLLWCAWFLSCSKKHPSNDNVRTNTRLPRCSWNNQRQMMTAKTATLQDWMDHTDETFHFLDPGTALEIRSALLQWYRTHRRRLPWRGDPPPWDGSTADWSNNNKPGVSSTSKLPVTAYGIWVSEIMLQQTRVETVIPYWVTWMQRFPTVQALADATEEQVNALWAGLGYYRRARFLHAAAKYVVQENNGQVPETVDDLLSLDGIGRYTASAIASIAYNVSVPVVDGNVCRVLARLCGITQHVKAPALKDKWGWTLAAQIVQAGNDGSNSGEVNQALMELGATFCAPSGTGIEKGDPLKRFYKSTRIGREVCEARRDGSLSSMLQTMNERVRSRTCPICDTSRIPLVIENICSRLDDAPPGSMLDFASRCGHAELPIAPPKTNRKEEIYAVGVIASVEKSTGVKRWLLTRRPCQGLLAGQWEFPSALLWSSDVAKTKGASVQVLPVISKKDRKRALSNLLGEVLSEEGGRIVAGFSDAEVKIAESPFEHIFSHIRHTMWLEHRHGIVEELEYTEWTDSLGRKVRWMRESEMDQVGVTAGVRKILKTVKHAASTVTPVTKRRRKH